MSETPRPNKSTNGRTKSAALRVTRAGFRVLSPHAPALAARWAERLFLTARRHERPSWEAEALSSATVDRLPHEGKWLPTWTWTPAMTSDGPEATGATLEAPPTVVLVHGWEGRGSQLAAFVPALLDRGFRVVTFDAPGHGDSPLARASLVEHARALCSLGRALGPVHAVIGHSVGGAATLFATRYGFLADRLALVAPPTTPASFAAVFAQTLGLAPQIEAAMVARLEARYDIRFAELDVRADAARLHQPMLVVHDHDDPIVPFASGKAIADTAPRGRLLAVSALGHRAILRAPSVIDAVTRFVDEEPTASFARTLDGELFMRDMRW